MDIAKDEITLAIVADGEKGDPGSPGADGKTYYTWIKYADSPTSGMSDNPSGKAYIGIAYNKTSATESTTYSDYTWSLIKGETGADGNGIATITQYYARTTTFTKPSADAITATSPPALDNTYRYLWLKEVVSFTKTTTQTMITLIAARGENGEMSAEQIAQLNQAVQNANTANTNASSAVNKVDNLQIGGRNLAKEANIQYTGTSYTKSENTYTMMCGNSAGIKFPANMFEEDQKYVLSFKFQKLNSVALTSMAGHCQMFQTYKIVINGSTITQNSQNWSPAHTIADSSAVQTCEVYLRRYKESEATTSDKNLYIQPQRGAYHSSNDIQVKFWDIKIEAGDKATDWTPAPEDVQNNIDGVQNNLDNLEVGGRNLITNTNASWVSGTYEGLTYTAINGIRSSIHIAGTTTNANSEKSIIGFIGSTRLLVEKNVPYSITVEGLPSNFRWRVSISGSDDKWHSATPWTTEKSITKTFTGTEYCFRYINMDYPSGVVFNNDVYLKIEKGNKPTNWSPAPEDVQSQIDNINKHLVFDNDSVDIVGDDGVTYASYGDTSTIGRVSKSHLQLDDNSVDLMVGNNRVGTFSSEGYVKTTISSWKTSTSTTKTFTVPTNKVESLISVTDANGRVFSNVGKLKDPDDPMIVDDSVMIIDHTGSSTPTLPITIEYMKKGAPAMLDVKGNISVGGGVKGIFKIWVEESATETYSSGTVKSIRFFLDELYDAENYTIIGVTSVTVYHGGATTSTGSALVVKDFGEVVTTAEEERPHVRVRVRNTGSSSQSGYVRVTILGIKQEL